MKRNGKLALMMSAAAALVCLPLAFGALKPSTPAVPAAPQVMGAGEHKTQHDPIHSPPDKHEGLGPHGTGDLPNAGLAVSDHESLVHEIEMIHETMDRLDSLVKHHTGHVQHCHAPKATTHGVPVSLNQHHNPSYSGHVHHKGDSVASKKDEDTKDSHSHKHSHVGEHPGDNSGVHDEATPHAGDEHMEAEQDSEHLHNTIEELRHRLLAFDLRKKAVCHENHKGHSDRDGGPGRHASDRHNPNADRGFHKGVDHRLEPPGP